MGDDDHSAAVPGLPVLPGFLPPPSGEVRLLLAELASARTRGVPALAVFEESLGDLAAAPDAVVVALLLCYRAEQAFDPFHDVVRRMRPELAAQPFTRQQHAFVLNRDGRSEEAEQILLRLREAEGPSPETNGILGRVYKDRLMAAHEAGDEATATEWRERAIATYLEGHDADPTNPYPGLNALALMEFEHPKRPRREPLAAEVAAASEARLAAGDARYWDHATAWELALMEGDEAAATAAMHLAAGTMEERWQAASTHYNTRMLRTAWAGLGLTPPEWMAPLEEQLAELARSPGPPPPGPPPAGGRPPTRPRRFRLRPPSGPGQWLLAALLAVGATVAGVALVAALTGGDETDPTDLTAADLTELGVRCEAAAVEVFGESPPSLAVPIPFREQAQVGDGVAFCATASAGETLAITVTFDRDPGVNVRFDMRSPSGEFEVRPASEEMADPAVFELEAAIGADDVYLMRVVGAAGSYTLEVTR